MAGKVIRTEIKMDRDGKSRGFGTVTFEHPMEAAQAVCILIKKALLLVSVLLFHIFLLWLNKLLL